MMYFYIVSRDTTANTAWLCTISGDNIHCCIKKKKKNTLLYLLHYITQPFKREPKNVSNFLKHNFVLTILKTQERIFGEA